MIGGRGFRRADEDWLISQGIAPYTAAEIAQAKEALIRIGQALVPVAEAYVTAVNGAAKALAGLADALITADVEADCEAATLLDPQAPTADEIASRSGSEPRPHTNPRERGGRGT